MKITADKKIIEISPQGLKELVIDYAKLCQAKQLQPQHLQPNTNLPISFLEYASIAMPKDSPAKKILQSGQFKCSIKDFDFSNYDLSVCNFAHVEFKKCEFKNSNLSSTIFNYCSFKECIFDHTNLSKSVLSHSKFMLSDFTYCDLSFSNWGYCDVKACDFINSNLYKTNFGQLLYTNCSLNGCIYIDLQSSTNQHNINRARQHGAAITSLKELIIEAGKIDSRHWQGTTDNLYQFYKVLQLAIRDKATNQDDINSCKKLAADIAYYYPNLHKAPAETCFDPTLKAAKEVIRKLRLITPKTNPLPLANIDGMLQEMFAHPLLNKDLVLKLVENFKGNKNLKLQTQQKQALLINIITEHTSTPEERALLSKSRQVSPDVQNPTKSQLGNHGQNLGKN